MARLELEELLERVARGDQEAFERLYREMERPLYRFVIARLNDPFRSADIIHDVFLDVWRSAGSFEKRSSARTWIFALAYRKVIDVFRREGRLIYGDDVPEEADESPGPEACVLAIEEQGAVRGCLETLSAEQRAAIELTFFEDMSYAEVAEVTGVPEGTVKSRVYHAKQLLMRCLAARLKMGGKG